MSRLIKLNNISDDQLSDILNKEIIVFEDVQGSKIYVNWNGTEFSIRPKSVSNDSLNLIDMSLQKYYNHAVNYFNSLDSRIKGLLNRSWNFCFEYFPDQSPGNIEYSKVPKNHLVLTSIVKGNKHIHNVDEIEEYSRLFDVDSLPIIFKGKLSDSAIEAIKYFLNTSEKDLDYVFGDKSFSFFFYKILNPQNSESFLMENDFQKNLEKIIIRTADDNEASFELLNPLYKRISDSNSTEFVEIYSLILINFLNFCQSIHYDSLKLKGTKRDEIYIYFICKIYNMYISESKNDLINFDFVIPEFFDKEKFRINTELITNSMTKSYIEEDPKLEYIFKIVLSSFNKKRKKPIGVFTEKTLVNFNNFVDFINQKIDNYLNKKSEVDMVNKGLIDFSQFFDLKIDKDGSGDVFIQDTYDEIQKVNDEKDKKKGKFDTKFDNSVVKK